MVMFLPLPRDTVDFVFRKGSLRSFSNLGLLYNKYITWNNGTQDRFSLEKNNNFTKDVITYFQRNDCSNYLNAVLSRQNSLLEDLKTHQGYSVKTLSLKTDYRLVIGLGSAHVLETGLVLHPVYGFPYIPSSSIKGLTRAYAERFGNAISNDLREVFGSEDKDVVSENNREGRVIFLDGIPAKFPEIEEDIMNPHYSEYYQGDKPPADYLNPVPIKFLTVAPGQKFVFSLFSKDNNLLEKAADWLEKALLEMGAGGKTNVGYGYFVKDVEKTDNNKMMDDGYGCKVDDLFNQIKHIKRADKKELFMKVLNEAKATLSVEEKRLFLEKIKKEISKDFLKNEKIRPIIQDFEKDL